MRVVEHLGGGLGLDGLVEVQRVVHDRVRLRVVDVDVVQVGEVLVVVVVHDVQGDVLGRLDGALLLREDVALLGFVVLGGLLRGGRPIGVVDISFRHFVLFRFVGAGCLHVAPRLAQCRVRCGQAGNAEDDGRQPDEQQVESVDDRHHHDDEAEHDSRELHQLLAGRRDDLAELREDLTDEQGDAREDVRLLLARCVALRDDLALRLVLNHRTHLITFRVSA